MEITPIHPEDAADHKFFAALCDHDKNQLRPLSGELRADIFKVLDGAVVRFHSKYGRTPYTRVVMTSDTSRRVILNAKAECDLEEYGRIVAECDYWVRSQSDDLRYHHTMRNSAYAAGVFSYKAQIMR